MRVFLIMESLKKASYSMKAGGIWILGFVGLLGFM